MFTKKTRCKVCGYRFELEKANVYTAQEPRAFAETLSKPPISFSATDCPKCGCQIMLRVRAPRISAPPKDYPNKPNAEGDKAALRAEEAEATNSRTNEIEREGVE